MAYNTRFAPSPTGELHVGGLFSALFDLILARQSGGRFLLRIEDTDRKRFVEGSTERIIEMLQWAKVTPDEKPIYQSERLPIYKENAEKLIALGHAYYCFCSEDRLAQVHKEQEEKHLPPKYDRFCSTIPLEEAQKRVAAGEPYVIRMRMPDNQIIKVQDEVRGEMDFNSSTLDDSVLLKSDGFPTYHLAAMIDDHLMGINFVVRGEEWLPSAPKHVLLYQFFGWEAPLWFHTPTFRNIDRKKLSKRRDSVSVKEFKDEGYLPEAMLNYFLLLVWGREKDQEIFSVSDAIRDLDIHRISIAAPVFDVQKLEWLNGEYIRILSDEGLRRRLIDFYQGRLPESVFDLEIIKIVKERIKKLSEYEVLTDFFVVDDVDYEPSLLAQGGLSVDLAKKALEKLLNEKLKNLPSWDHENIEKAVRDVADEVGFKAKDLFMSLRVAVTGKTITPPLIESMIILGKDKIIERLEKACARL